MKQYIWSVMVVAVVGANASGNPFDVDRELQQIDQEESSLFLALDRVVETPTSKKPAVATPHPTQPHTKKKPALDPAQIEALQQEQAKARAEAQRLLKAEREAARKKREALAKQEAEAKKLAQAKAKRKEEAEAKAKREAAAKAKAQQEAQAKQEAEAKKQAEAKAEAKRKAEAEAKKLAQAKAKRKEEVEAKAKREAAAKAKAQQEVEAKPEAHAKEEPTTLPETTTPHAEAPDSLSKAQIEAQIKGAGQISLSDAEKAEEKAAADRAYEQAVKEVM